MQKGLELGRVAEELDTESLPPLVVLGDEGAVKDPGGLQQGGLSNGQHCLWSADTEFL